MEKSKITANIKNLVKEGEFTSAFNELCLKADKWAHFIEQLSYVRLFASIDASALGLKPLRLAVLPTSTVDHLIPILKFWLARCGFDAQIYVAEYDNIDQEILNSESSLYAFNPEVVVLFSGFRDIKLKPGISASSQQVDQMSDQYIDQLRNYWSILQERLNCFIIQNNIDLPLSRVLGNYEANAVWGELGLYRKINQSLTEKVAPGTTVFDMDYLSSLYGKKQWFQPRFWYHSKHAFDTDAYGLVAHSLASVIAGIKGTAKKCLVFDLDNTLWGGVIADDGIENIMLGHGAVGEAYVDFQKYLLELKKRGIILCVCSKNDDNIAKIPFAEHPDMQIRLDDIAVFKANWENKAENIRQISQDLNIGLDAIVFIDDNPFERELVRSFLPMVAVPEMPSDPVDYIFALDQERYFETVSVSAEDEQRNQLYQENFKRANYQNKFQDIDAYLQQLDMQMKVGRFDSFHLPRIAQLINKSNQFHLTTTRYNESQISKFMQDPSYETLYFRLKDKFGDNGLIAAVILKKQEDKGIAIDTWVTSCRVLNRGVEEFILNEIITLAENRKMDKIIGRYIPTAKNRLVEHLYKRLGFDLVADNNGTTTWELKIGGGPGRLKTYIRAENTS